MLKIWLLILLLVLSVTCFSQLPVFDGAVKSSKDGRAIPFATVMVTGYKAYQCDSLGKFQLTGLTQGTHTVSVISAGYARTVKQIFFPGAATLFANPLEGQLDQVVVTAVSGNTKIKRTPVAIAIATQKEMNRNSSSNIIDALVKLVPGVNAVTTGPNISKPFIRGLGYNRVVTMYDGVRQEGQQWGDEHGIEVDPYGIARAEIVKGPASISYGSDAIAGVINLIPIQPSDNDGTIHGDIATEYQSNNHMLGESTGLYYKKDRFSWSIRQSARQATNYQNTVDDYVYNTAFKERNLSAMLGWEKEKIKNHLYVTWYDNLQEIPDGSRDSASRHFTYQANESHQDNIRNRPLVPSDRLRSYTISPLHQHIQHFRGYHKGQYTFQAGQLTTTVGFQQNTRREFNHPAYPSQAGLYVALQTLNYDAKFSFREWKRLYVTSGINGMLQQNKSKNATDFPIPDYHLFDFGAYSMVKKEWKKWVITAGTRIDKRWVSWPEMYTRKELLSGLVKQVTISDTIGAIQNFNAFSQNFTGISASIGAVFNLSDDITFKTNIARGYRSPNITEMGSDGLDPGAHIYYIGSKTFVPEYNLQEDIGAFINRPDIDLSVEFFHNEISNYIFLQKLFDGNGRPLEIIPGNFTYAYRQGSARLFGTEISFRWHPIAMPWIQINNSFSAITGLNTDNAAINSLGEQAKYLPLIPPAKNLSRLQFNFAYANRRFSEGYFFSELELSASQTKFYGVDQTETATPGYALFNMGAGIRINSSRKQGGCRISVNLNNVFDIAYQSHLNRLKYFEYYSGNHPSGIYNMGRSLGLKAIFNW